MELVITPRGNLQIDDASLRFKNFSGEPDMYTREGDRSFCVLIPTQEMADDLIERGWNVKIKPPREEGDDPFMYLKVKISYRFGGPRAYLIVGNARRELTEDTIGMLDHIDIESVDMDISASDWSQPNGKSGRTAYLDSIHVVQKLDRFAARYANAEE
jgi:hypothetical protein